MIKRKDWKATKSSVLCSEHFEASAYKRPPGASKMKPLLKSEAMPTKFPTLPALLQPTPPKRRRILVRSPLVQQSASDSQDIVQDEADSPPTPPPPSAPPAATTTIAPKRKRGRPKVSPEVRIPAMKRTIDTLQQKVSRLKKRTRIQKNLLKMLQKENKLQFAQLDSIEGCIGELLKNQAINKGRKTNKTYSQKIKEFALTLYFYSPKAYAYMRSLFNLPTSRTIRRWLEAVDCEPGFLTDVIKRVAATCPPDRNAYSLVVDGMSIRKMLVTNRSNNNIEGYCTIGDSKKMAGEALVFLLVPVMGGARYPIGYFLIDKCDSEVQAQLLKQCLALTGEENLRVVNITCDGCPANISTLRKLGADVPANTSFKHPSMDHDVFVTLDPVHMMKLARNTIGSMRRFKSQDGLIDYKYIEELIQLQEDMGVRLANKLTKRHLNWANMKMKVKLAAQMLSSSVADSLQYLSETDDKFKDAGPTIAFIRKV